MLEEIKKIQGINHDDFDNIINIWINAAKLDLKSIGIVDTLIDTNPDEIIQTAIITYVLKFLDVANSKLYESSYTLQKDVLRHLTEYTVESDDENASESTLEDD